MAKLGISTGSSANDGTGDNLIDGAVKINSNFNEIYTLIGDGSTLAAPVKSVTAGAGINLSGSTGDVTITNTGIANTNNLRTNFLEVSGVSTLSGNVTFGSNVTFDGNILMGDSDEIRLGAGADLKIYHSPAGDVGAFVQSMNQDLHLVGPTNGGVRIITYNKDSVVANYNSSVDLYYNGSKKLETTDHGAKVTGVCSATSFIGDGSNLTGIAAGSGVIVQDEGVALATTATTLNFVGNGVVASGTGASKTITISGGGGAGNTANVSTNSLVVVGVASIGAGTSTNVVEAPGLTLTHNNSTVTTTPGISGQIKQIGSQPYYYDGTDWRALYLVAGVSTANTADTDWDNTMIRMNFDQANIGALTNLKDGVAPTNTSTTDLVSSPVKYGTKSVRFPANTAGIQFDQNNSGSVRYPFEGAWTIEGWFLFDAGQLTTNTTTVSATKLFANYNSNTGTGTNWDVGVYWSGSTGSYKFYWHNRASSNTGSGEAGNSGTGFVLRTLNSSVFADNNWHHIALVREPGNGSIHFYFDGVEGGETNNDELIDNDINDATNKVFALGYHSHVNVGTGWFDGNIDDFRVSNIARYTTDFTPPSSALPITGSTTTVIQPPDSKIGELALGNSPAWTGTPGVTPTRVAAGHYRVTFATAYSNASDYVIQTSMNDYTPVTTAVGIGVSRFTTHADLYVNKVSNGATIDTGSIAIDLYKK